MKILITGSSKNWVSKLHKNYRKTIMSLFYTVTLTMKNYKTFSFNKKIHIVREDLSSPNGALNLFNKTCDLIGFPDSIINNAGIAESSPIEKNTEEWANEFDKTISVNLKSPAIICKEFISKKKEKKILKIDLEL